MEKLKENFIEIILLIGIINISIGFFIYSAVAGFISTGFMLISLALLLLYKGGD
ncbi:hypothetical protein [Tissierella sp.]|uniref:hypothetical protein n=1 Tax=Tissierella sp. TaxID=41274 RepID=UPI0030481A25